MEIGRHAGCAAGRPRRGLYYGWVLVLVLAFTETTSWGVLFYSFTVFLTPMGDEFGWSRGTMTGAFSLALALSAIAGVPAGRWFDRHGPRVLMTAGSCLAVVLVLAWAAVPNLLAFYLVWAAIGVVMTAVLYDPAMVVVATWFSRRRGRALTVLTFLAGFASVIYIPLAGRLVEWQGWRGALVTLAVLLAVLTIPLHAFVLRRPPQQLPDDELPVATGAGAPLERSIATSTAIRGAAFWWLTGAFALNALGQVGLTVNLVPYLTDRGYDPAWAAGAAGLVGIMALPGRLIFTPLGDVLPRGLLTAFLFMLQAFALIVLVSVHTTLGVLGFVFLFGAGFGALTPARTALVAQFYGPANFGAIAGFLSLFVTGARAVGPVGVGVAHDLRDSYDPVLWSLVAVSVAAAIAVALAERSAKATVAPTDTWRR